jgi:hypothetical protein
MHARTLLLNILYLYSHTHTPLNTEWIDRRVRLEKWVVRMVKVFSDDTNTNGKALHRVAPYRIENTRYFIVLHGWRRW